MKCNQLFMFNSTKIGYKSIAKLSFLTVALFTISLATSSFAILGNDSIVKRLENDSLHFTNVLDSIKANKSLKDKSRVLKLSQLLEIKPKTKTDSVIYRETLMRYAVLIKNNLGNISLSQEYYLKAHEYASDKVLFDKWCWYIEKAISSNYGRLNEYDKSKYFARLVEHYLIYNKEYGRLGRVYSDLGNLYLWQEHFSVAKEYYNKGLTYSLKANNYLGIVGNALNISTLSRLEGDYETSAYYQNISYNAILKLDKGKEKYIRVGSYWLENGAYDFDLGLYNSSIDAYEKALTNYDQAYIGIVSREKAKIFRDIGNSYLAMNDLCEATSAFSEGMAKLALPSDLSLLLKSTLYKENTIVELLELNSRINFKKYQINSNYLFLDSAILCLELASEINDQLQNDLVDSKSKFISIAYNKKLVSLGLKYLYERKKYHSSSKAEAVIDSKVKIFFDRSKSIYLLEELSIKKAMKSLPRETQEDLGYINYAMMDLVENNAKGLISQEEFESKYFIEKEKFNKITSKLEKLSTAEIKGTYVEFVETVENEYYSLNNFEEPYFRKIERLKKDSLSTLINDIKRNEDISLTLAKLSNFYSLLLPETASEQHDLTIIPDGILNFLAFEVLRRNDKFLIEYIPLNYSVTRKNIVDNKATETEKTLFCLAPDYSCLKKTDNTSDVTHLEALTEVAKEVKKINQFWNGKFTEINEGNIEMVMDLSKNYDAFHYAGHVMMDGDSSYLAFVNYGQVENVYSEMIIHWPHSFKMVILSACETGIGAFKKGEGIQSLANAFAIGGAKTILHSLWRANDQSTSQLMDYFYDFLNKGVGSNVALQQAKLKYLKEAPPYMKHPYYWSGLVVNNMNTTQQPSYYRKFFKEKNRLIILIPFLVLFLIFWRRANS